MTDYDNVVTNLKAIEKVLTLDSDQADIISMTDKMHRLINISCLAADCEARAEALMNRSKKTEILLAMKEYPNLGANLIKEVSNAAASDQIGLHTKAVRLGRLVSHAQESLRSCISLYKSELEQNT